MVGVTAMLVIVVLLAVAWLDAEVLIIGVIETTGPERGPI